MPFIWQISILKFKRRTILNGIILHGKPPVQKKANAINTFTTVIGSYFKKTYANKKIVIAIDGVQHPSITDDKGGFSLELESPVNNNFEISPKNSLKSFEVLQSYPVVFNDADFPLAIISDIDDTILVSYTLNIWKRVITLLFVSPDKRKPVNFTQAILNKINAKKGRIFYVSKSEGNLFGMLTNFIKNNNLPTGNLMLTPYLITNQLLNPKKGIDFKERMIRLVMENSPEKKFILMGDDTQQDIAVYTKIARLYPKRIFKIYIRKTRKNLLGKKQEQLDKIMDLSVPVLYFNDTSDVLKEINLVDNQ